MSEQGNQTEVMNIDEQDYFLPEGFTDDAKSFDEEVSTDTSEEGKEENATESEEQASDDEEVEKKLSEYIFTKEARDIEEFEGMCQYHQTSPNSHFTQKRLISKPSKNGRITISGDSLKITENEKVVVQKKIENESEFTEYLKQYFNINESELKYATNKM